MLRADLFWKNYRIEGIYDAVPKNLTTLAKELFRMAVCIKPRLIRTGLQNIQDINRLPLENFQTGISNYGSGDG